jgi:hypothetical protein
VLEIFFRRCGLRLEPGAEEEKSVSQEIPTVYHTLVQPERAEHLLELWRSRDWSSDD